MIKRTRLDQLRIFRYFTGIAMIYFAVLVIVTAIQTGEGDSLTQVQAYVNFATNLILFIYLSLTWFRIKLRSLYLPIALIYATVVPIFSNLIYLADPYENIFNLITKSWLLFPILIVPIVLIAWQYKFRYVVLIVIFSTYMEMFVLIPHIRMINIDAFLILGGPLIRAFAFGTVGLIVNTLVAIQRTQRRELVLANIRLSEHSQTLEQLATSRERNRLARELHDTLAHTLSGQAVNLEAIKLMIPPDQIDVQEMLEHSLLNTRAGLDETRRAMKDLRSQQLEDLGLEMAIRNLAMNASLRGGFTVSTKFSKPLPDVTSDIEQSVYRIAQESLENAIRHANAKNVEINLEKHDHFLIMNISDDGIGFNIQNTANNDKLGLKGMRERAAILKADLSIFSEPNNGTSVQLSIPLPWTINT